MTCIEFETGPQTGGEATYHIRASRLPVERASEREARDDENYGEDGAERESDVCQTQLSVKEAEIVAITDKIAKVKPVPYCGHGDREDEKQEAEAGDRPVRNKLPRLSSVWNSSNPFAIYDQL